MKILYLSHRIPYPPNKGDKIRSFNEIKYLSNSHEIDLVCLADNLNDMQYQQDLNQYCRRVFVSPLNTTWAKLKGLTCVASGKPVSVGYFYWNKLQQTVDRWLKQTDYDAIICFSSPMAEYIFHTPSLRHRLANHQSYINKPFIHNPKLVMDFCDVDSDKWAQYAGLTSFPKSFIYTLENHRLARYEKKIAEHFNHSIFVSQKEAEIFLNKNPHVANVTVIPNGVDYNYFAPQKRYRAQGSGQKEIPRKTMRLQPNSESEIPARQRERSDEAGGLNPKLGTRPKGGGPKDKSEISPMPHVYPVKFATGDHFTGAPCPMLLFTGAMDYHANVDGVKWFCEKIFPGIKASLPEAQFYIVGSNPNQGVQNLGNGDDIRVPGFVEDIRPFYEKADICVIPLRLARGIQNKVLEAMSMEKAVIATPEAIQGISAVNGEHLIVADEPKDFAQSVVTLLNDTNRRRTLGENARRFVEANYDWQTNMKKLEELLITRGQKETWATR